MSGKHVVIDSGSGSCKAGFAGDDKPTAIVPSIIGRPKQTESLISEKNTSSQGMFVGQDALDHNGELTFSYPVDRGVVQNWDDMEEIWNYMFSKGLQINPCDHAVMMVESPESNINRKNQEKIYEVMFEKFRIAGMHIAMDSVLSLWASGRKTGIVCTSGDSLSHIVPMYEGYQLSEGIVSVNLGGRDLTDYLNRLLTEKGYSFTGGGDNRAFILNQVKEKYSYVAEDFQKELESPTSTIQEKFTFPDGYEIQLDQERFKCAEALFDPSVIGIQSAGLADLLYQSIMKCDMDVRKDLYHNIVLAGGTTLIPGFEERLKNELSALVPKTIHVQIASPVDRGISSWVGGSIFASTNEFEAKMTTLQQFQECGLSSIPLLSGIF